MEQGLDRDGLIGASGRPVVGCGGRRGSSQLRAHRRLSRIDRGFPVTQLRQPALRPDRYYAGASSLGRPAGSGATATVDWHSRQPYAPIETLPYELAVPSTLTR